jgi:hypothetical protein
MLCPGPNTGFTCTIYDLMICREDDYRFNSVQFQVKFVKSYPSYQFRLNIKAVLVAAFYNNLFVH